MSEPMRILLPPAAMNSDDDDYLYGWCEGQAYLIANYGKTEDFDKAIEAAALIQSLRTKVAELTEDVALWKREAADRSEGMVQLNLDRAAMGVENMRLLEQFAELTRERDAYEEEAHQIGRRDGRSETLAEIDRLTGGDGEYRYCTDHGERHCPDEEAMLAKIVARFSGLTRERDEARHELREVSKVVVGHLGGGSEWFKPLGDEYYADAKAIGPELQRRKTEAQITKMALVRANRERDEAAEKERAAVDRVTKSIIATGAHQEQSNG